MVSHSCMMDGVFMMTVSNFNDEVVVSAVYLSLEALLVQVQAF